MKRIILVSLTLVIIILTQIIDVSSKGENKLQKVKYTIVIHGGAGTIDKSLPDSVKDKYYNSLKKALKIGQDILAKGGTSLNAVEQVIRFFENDPKFNAGIGAVLTSKGTVELDAAIMNGADLSCGAVASAKTIKNPISLARLVMEKTPYVFLVADGADKFANEMRVDQVDNSYFIVKKRYRQWLKYREKYERNKKGTVGAAALDKYGNLAAATSTGGTPFKMPGRVGDSPIIGAGTYANNKTCAISATGWGEKFIKNTVAFNISALMEYKKLSLKEAADEIIYERLQPGDGGVIAVDKEGNYAMPFNTKAMFRGVANSDGLFEVNIW